MGIFGKFVFVALVTLAVCLGGAPVAMGIANFRYDVIVQTSSSSPNRIYVDGLDPAKTTTIRVKRGAFQITRDNFAAGSTLRTSTTTPAPGDVIEVYQPQADAGNPPIAFPDDTFTVPVLNVSPAAGNPTVTGATEDGVSIRVQRTMSCNGDEDSVAATVGGGSYSATFATPLTAGERATAVATQADGDRVFADDMAAGETICLNVDGTLATLQGDPGPLPPGGTMYSVYATGLNDSGINDARFVLRRGAGVVNETFPAPPVTSSFLAWLVPNQRPLPGDTIDVYRPAGAGAPTVSWTIPQLSATFDAASDLVAIDAPAASELTASTCRAGDCVGGERVSVDNTADGRTLFSFKTGKQVAAADFPSGGYDIRPDDQVFGVWVSPDGRFNYSFHASAGDLTPPSVKMTLKKTVSLAKLAKRKIKVTVTSNEAGTALLRLKVKNAKRKTIVIAKGKGNLKAGSVKLRLKLTKAGKRYMRNAKRSRATLTGVFTDAAGNRTTAERKLTLSRR